MQIDVKQILEDFDPVKTYRRIHFDRYTSERIPIQTEENPAYIDADVNEKSKPDRRLYNHFEKEIVNTKVSYLFGHPVYTASYNGDERVDTLIDDFHVAVDHEDLFSEIGKMAAICGTGFALLYKDADAYIQAVEIPPYECDVVYRLKDPVAAFRIYKKDDDTRVFEYFDSDYVYTFHEYKDEWIPKGKVLHGFSRVPIIEVKNNRERQSDFHSVTPLIDAYNRLISDLSNEIESFRLAYLILKNMNASEEDLKALRKTGALSVDADGDAYYLTKKLDASAVEIGRKILELNIARFSGHVVFSNQEFTGNLTRIAVQFKVRPLEDKARTFELKFKKFLREFYRTMASFKGFSTVPFNYLDLTFRMTRSLPVNLSDEIDSFVKLGGTLSDQTKLGMLSFVDNPDDELALIEAERNSNNSEGDENDSD